ncbi:glycosyl hydrolase 115 family protein [Leeuwenhoekiella sp. MAR_2009_132]|uniref:glycosyl hydrolase 115 family protein n=1 Tax=Leeuwenhoekiella sp. MAR_2009_132 TaxID=1392489 RepID=UPI00068A4769|nr:glycosyl hydrolase 115 family protein [Leeuwenhoekiella sp. MAR_2009_132]
MKSSFLFLLLVSAACISCGSATQKETLNNSNFELVTADTKTAIIYDANGPALDSISAYLLAQDIEQVTGFKPQVVTRIVEVSGNVIAIGNRDSQLIKALVNDQNKLPAANAWETYTHTLVHNPAERIQKALVISGADPRGTAYGVFSISQKIGVSPWYWWADVTPTPQENLVLAIDDFQSVSPAVQFRGIFINDEDWGLQPWAAKTFEPETGDIGPKTYAKVFELLLRLRANTIWPAMHPSTKAFFHYPGNAKVAEDYEIVLGSSHAEPMLRNNVDEWDHDTMGDFNYFSNKKGVLNYWEERVAEAKNVNGIYTIGMRGVHDSGMEGAKNTADAAAILNDVIKDQRALLQKHIGDPKQVPQVFTVYKEVLDLYEYGLDLPEDITLMWTDDNYGYFRQLSNAEERKRTGGSGVYYHASYWGRPHDYLWLSTTHPALIREELLKAYDTGADKIWILNVGDIKPAEYNTQFFMDLAFEPERFRKPENYLTHMQQFYGSIFGENLASEISDIRHTYYDLAWLRKPEFMGWSQTEPTRATHLTGFSLSPENDENTKRIAAYEALSKKVYTTQNEIPKHRTDAWYQLVVYPVLGSSAMNKKYLYRDLATHYSKTNRQKAEEYKNAIRANQEEMAQLTSTYNSLANGKWNGIMDPAPRRLPVFELPEILDDESKSTEAPKLALVHNAADYTRATNFEAGFPQQLNGLGYSGQILQLAASDATTIKELAATTPVLSYEIELLEDLKNADFTLTALPNHPTTGNQNLKIGIQLNDNTVEILDFETFGRSEEWKQNVLRNQARKSLNLGVLKAGTHTIKIYRLDPGVLPDYFILAENGTALPYTLPLTD